MSSRMLPLVAVIIMVFFVTSVITFFVLERTLTPEKVQAGKQDNANVMISIKGPPKTQTGVVSINIVNHSNKGD